MNRAEKKHLDRVADIGCIVCLNLGYGRSPCEIHHIRSGQGMSIRADNYSTIGLCAIHHRLGGHGVAIHAGQKTWESLYGTELELLAQVRRLLEREDAA